MRTDMTMRTLWTRELLRNGEGLSVEFKRCSGRIEHDVFETICAFDCSRMETDIQGAFDCNLWYNV